MITNPVLFLARDCGVRSGAGRSVPDENQFEFRPGWLSFQILCELHVGNRVPGGEPFARDPLILVDGPPEPAIDEGIQLFRFNPHATASLAELTTLEIATIAAAWHARLKRFHGLFQDTEISNLTVALEGVASLARQARCSGRTMFLEILVR